jgi:hypothetical protein
MSAEQDKESIYNGETKTFIEKEDKKYKPKKPIVPNNKLSILVDESTGYYKLKATKSRLPNNELYKYEFDEPLKVKGEIIKKFKLKKHEIPPEMIDEVIEYNKSKSNEILKI